MGESDTVSLEVLRSDVKGMVNALRAFQHAQRVLDGVEQAEQRVREAERALAAKRHVLEEAETRHARLIQALSALDDQVIRTTRDAEAETVRLQQQVELDVAAHRARLQQEMDEHFRSLAGELARRRDALAQAEQDGRDQIAALETQIATLTPTADALQARVAAFQARIDEMVAQFVKPSTTPD